MRWIPWSARQSPEQAREYIRPRPGVSDGVLSVMLDLVLGHFYVQGYTAQFMLHREKASRYVRVFHESLPWNIEGAAHYFSENRTKLVDAFDLVPSELSVDGYGHAQLSAKLNRDLDEARSEFVIRQNLEGKYELQQITDPITTSILDEVLQGKDRASHLMSQAWSKLYSRSPDPTAAVLDAVKALEVISAPIVTPGDLEPTLGKIVKCLQAKPEKWHGVCGGVLLVERIANDLDFIWTHQRGSRHGHPDKEIDIPSEVAEVLLQMALCNFELLRRDAIQLLDVRENF